MLEKYVDSLYKELKNKLPGKEVQYKMAPFNHPKNMPFADDSVDAAVLLFIYPKNKSIYTLLIQRANYEGIHSGQISLPGGKYETKDKNFKQTALRETHEEIGINPSEIEIIGQLSPLHIPVSNFNVYPFIGYSKKKPDFFPNCEVNQILEINIKSFTNTNIFISEKTGSKGFKFNAPVYKINNKDIWGATAMILSEFSEINNNIQLTHQ